MKRNLAIVLTLVMTASLFAGCGAKTEESQPAAAEAPSAAEEPGEVSSEEAAPTTDESGDVIKIGWTKQTSTEYYTEFEKYVKQGIEGEFGAENVEFLGWFDGNNDVQTQLDQVKTFVTMDADFVLCCPVNPAMTEEIMNIVEGTDTTVVFTNTPPDYDYLENFKNETTYIGSDEWNGGECEGKWAAEELKKRGYVPGEDVINLVILMGNLGNPNVTTRTESAKAGLTDAGFEINMVAEQTGNFNRTEGLDITTQLLGTGAQIDCIIANNDDMALGAIEALKAVGKEKDVVVCGLDGTLNAYYAIKEGTLLMTASQDMSKEGVVIGETLRKFLNGEDVDTKCYLPYDVVDASNVDEYITASEAGEK